MSCGPRRFNTLTALGAVFRLAVRRKWATMHPVRALSRDERPKRKRVPRRHLSREEIGRVLVASEGQWCVLFATAIFTGLRQGELIGLRWRDVDIDGRRVTVSRQLARGNGRTRRRTEPKTERSYRSVPLPDVLVRMLAAHKLASAWSGADDPVFTLDGGWLDHRVASSHWQRVRKAAKLADPVPRFHDLRRTAVSVWIDTGASIRYVAEKLGDTPSMALDTYADLWEAQASEERLVQAVDAAFEGVAR